MMTTQTSEQVTCHLKLNRSEYEALRKRAEAERRTIHNLMRILIQDGLKRGAK